MFRNTTADRPPHLGYLDEVWEVGLQVVSLEGVVETLPALLPVTAVGKLYAIRAYHWLKAFKQFSCSVVSVCVYFLRVLSFYCVQYNMFQSFF